MREDDSLARHARQAHVRQDGERRSDLHLRQCAERGSRPRAVVRAEGRDVERVQPRRSLRGRDARQRVAGGVEAHERDDRQARDRAQRDDSRLQVVEVGKRLDEEELDTAALERARLLGVVATGADRAGDEHFSAGDLAGLAGELDGS